MKIKEILNIMSKIKRVTIFTCDSIDSIKNMNAYIQTQQNDGYEVEVMTSSASNSFPVNYGLNGSYEMIKIVPSIVVVVKENVSTSFDNNNYDRIARVALRMACNDYLQSNKEVQETTTQLFNEYLKAAKGELEKDYNA